MVDWIALALANGIRSVVLGMMTVISFFVHGPCCEPPETASFRPEDFAASVEALSRCQAVEEIAISVGAPPRCEPIAGFAVTVEALPCCEPDEVVAPRMKTPARAGLTGAEVVELERAFELLGSVVPPIRVETLYSPDVLRPLVVIERRDPLEGA